MKVKFMYNRVERDLYAYFPESIMSGIFGVMYECYGDGQHSLCDRNYIEDSREADPERYNPLLKELKTIYNDIEVI